MLVITNSGALACVRVSWRPTAANGRQPRPTAAGGKLRQNGAECLLFAALATRNMCKWLFLARVSPLFFGEIGDFA